MTELDVSKGGTLIKGTLPEYLLEVRTHHSISKLALECLLSLYMYIPIKSFLYKYVCTNFVTPYAFSKVTKH